MRSRKVGCVYVRKVSSQNAASSIAAYHVDWDLLTNTQQLIPFIPTALGTEIVLDGPYDAEIAVAFATPSPLDEAVIMGLAHRGAVVMWSLLFDQATGSDRVGYEYGID